ncbi:unnamed protein product [Miscanthus lutarioriparius]|uniref:Transcription repressor n=1 Tax=Miscanthus lutarioriparius TaxID=422564 RepID=A0A811MWE7_9POAL|nr:unnamed protein product [Miscanthus lutarioriparius]
MRGGCCRAGAAPAACCASRRRPAASYRRVNHSPYRHVDHHHHDQVDEKRREEQAGGGGDDVNHGGSLLVISLVFLRGHHRRRRAQQHGEHAQPVGAPAPARRAGASVRFLHPAGPAPAGNGAEAGGGTDGNKQQNGGDGGGRRQRRTVSEGCGGGSGRVEESVAVVKESADPLGDFRRSMLQMIVENEIVGGAELRELLHRFLSLNSPHHHHLILRAFAEIWEEVFAGYERTPDLLVSHRNKKQHHLATTRGA